MKVIINEVTTDVNSPTLQALVLHLSLPLEGVAIAVDNALVPRHTWPDFVLYEGANIVIIKAACGG